MFNRKRKQYIILVLSPRMGYLAELIGQYTSSLDLALKLSKKDAEALHKNLRHLGFVPTILEYEGGDNNDTRRDT